MNKNKDFTVFFALDSVFVCADFLNFCKQIVIRHAE